MQRLFYTTQKKKIKILKKMKKYKNSNMKKHLSFCVFAIFSIAVQIAEAALPQEIPVAAVFDEEGDPKLQLAFVHGVDRINQDPTILPGKMLVPQIIMIPAGKR